MNITTKMIIKFDNIDPFSQCKQRYAVTHIYKSQAWLIVR